MNTYERFIPARPLSQYAGQSGHEVGGTALSADAYAALADSKTSGLPCELAVVGAFHGPKGETWLDFAVTTAYIEAVTDYRHDRDQGRLRLVCPSCSQKDGRHSKSCDR